MKQFFVSQVPGSELKGRTEYPWKMAPSAIFKTMAEFHVEWPGERILNVNDVRCLPSGQFVAQYVWHYKHEKTTTVCSSVYICAAVKCEKHVGNRMKNVAFCKFCHPTWSPTYPLSDMGKQWRWRWDEWGWVKEGDIYPPPHTNYWRCSHWLPHSNLHSGALFCLPAFLSPFCHTDP